MFKTLDPVTFPVPPNLSMTHRVSFSNTVLGEISGDTQSQLNRDIAIWSWSLHLKRYSDDWGDVLGFFTARRGRGYGFLFEDPKDFTSTSNSGVGRVKTMPDGNRYLVKEYPDAFRPYYRIIRCAVADSVEFSGVSGTPVLEAYTGRVTGASSDGNAVFYFLCPVEFSTDMLELERDAAIGDWQNVQLRELTRFVVAETP